jgi:uncharacterized NAD(P)/FAD-binding protein YdhS
MPNSIVILGGGFAGAATAIKLVEAGYPAAQVTIVEPRAELGRGIAYGTPDLDHLVNGPARMFSLYPGDPGHLSRWLANHPDRRGWTGPADGNFDASFPPRYLYGDYVQSELARTGVRHVIDRAVDVVPEGEVMLASGRRLPASRIVLATGLVRNESGFAISGPVRTQGRYIGDPWAANAYDAVEGPDGDVAIIGSSLTMLDIVISLEKRGFRGRYCTFSRRGLIAHCRREVEAWPAFLDPENLPSRALALLRDIQRERRAIMAAGEDWQRLIVSLRPFIEPLWANASDIERRRFTRHLRTFWDLAFHRAVPDSIAWLDRVREQGRFFNVAGRVQRLTPSAESGVDVTWRPRGDAESQSRRFDYVVNAAGYESDWRRLPDTLARNLVARGAVKPHPIGFGIEADAATGAVIGSDGRPSRRLYAVGHPLRGAAWEASSVLEQIEGATRVARAVSAARMRDAA